VRRLAPALVVLAAVPLYVGLRAAVAPTPVALADPCRPRALPPTSSLSGSLQSLALTALDTAACRLGSSREELLLALLEPGEARRYERVHHVDLGPLQRTLSQFLR
jgi:hypothetical protein